MTGIFNNLFNSKEEFSAVAARQKTPEVKEKADKILNNDKIPNIWLLLLMMAFTFGLLLLFLWGGLKIFAKGSSDEIRYRSFYFGIGYIIFSLFALGSLGIFFLIRFASSCTEGGCDGSPSNDEMIKLNSEALYNNIEITALFIVWTASMIYHGLLNLEVFKPVWGGWIGWQQLLWLLNLLVITLYFLCSVYVAVFYDEDQINDLIRYLAPAQVARRISSRLQYVFIVLLGFYTYITSKANVTDKVGDALFAKTGDRNTLTNFVSRYDNTEKKLNFYKNIDWNKDKFIIQENGNINQDALKNALEKMNDVVTPKAKNYEPSFVLDSEYNKLGDNLKDMVKKVINDTKVIIE